MKLLKLLLIALVLVGVIWGLLELTGGGDHSIDVTEITSEAAKTWKQKVDSICQEGKWTANAYQEIESGVSSDYTVSNGELISGEEKQALDDYLFASSCKSLYDGADQLFRKPNFTDAQAGYYERAANFLNGKKAAFGSNSNLSALAEMCSLYRKILAIDNSVKVSSASYSHPLKAFSYSAPSGGNESVKASPYYKSHFSHNPTLRAKVEGSGSGNVDKSQAESRYYADLESAIENHYRSTQDIERLLEDQLRFEEISTNSTAKQRLRDFVNGRYN